MKRAAGRAPPIGQMTCSSGKAASDRRARTRVRRQMPSRTRILPLDQRSRCCPCRVSTPSEISSCFDVPCHQWARPSAARCSSHRGSQEMPRRPPSRRKPPPGHASPRRSRSRVLTFDSHSGDASQAQQPQQPQHGLLTARSGSSSALRRSADWALRDASTPDGGAAASGTAFTLPEPIPVTVPVSATNGQLPRDSPRRGEQAVAHSRPVRAASAGVAANVALMAALEAKADGSSAPAGVGAEPSAEAIAAAAAAGPAVKRLHRTSPGEPVVLSSHLSFQCEYSHRPLSSSCSVTSGQKQCAGRI